MGTHVAESTGFNNQRDAAGIWCRGTGKHVAIPAPTLYTPQISTHTATGTSIANTTRTNIHNTINK